jgi:chemotaxis protein MotA
VLGTSLCVLFIAFPAKNLKQLLGVTRQVVVAHHRSIDQLIDDMVSYAEVARRHVILSLENTTNHIYDPFIVRGIQMAVDGTDPELIEQIMNTELDNVIDRHEMGKGLLDALGRYAPAFGMIGTLVGLVIMLTNMDDASAGCPTGKV